MENGVFSQFLMAIIITELWGERLTTVSNNVQHFEHAPCVSVTHVLSVTYLVSRPGPCKRQQLFLPLRPSSLIATSVLCAFDATSSKSLGLQINQMKFSNYFSL